jgi:glycosyltransferase involved in cell wall biosynthesis
MRFSIVTPSRNQGRFLRDCIQSVADQQGVETEHLVLDACSTDETLAVLQSAPGVQWVSEPDQGQTDAIAKGFRRARGDWVMWLNADDYLVPGALQRVQELAAADPAADVIYGDCDFVDESRRVIGHKREGDFDWGMLLFYGCYIPSTATFIRRKVIEAGQVPDLAFRVCMDYEYYLRLAHAGYRFRHLAAPLACFRWHGSNYSTLHDDRSTAERLRLQRQYLQLANRSYLGQTWLLQALFRLYQVRRIARRTLRRVLPS